MYEINIVWNFSVYYKPIINFHCHYEYKRADNNQRNINIYCKTKNINRLSSEREIIKYYLNKNIDNDI